MVPGTDLSEIDFSTPILRVLQFPHFGSNGSMLRPPLSLIKMDQASLWLMHDSSTAPLMHTMGGSTFAFASLEADECHIMAILFSRFSQRLWKWGEHGWTLNKNPHEKSVYYRWKLYYFQRIRAFHAVMAQLTVVNGSITPKTRLIYHIISL